MVARADTRAAVVFFFDLPAVDFFAAGFLPLDFAADPALFEAGFFATVFLEAFLAPPPPEDFLVGVFLGVFFFVGLMGPGR